MNYHAHYDKLIARSRGRLLECYTEKHHIIPRCMGGSDDADNLAVLTAEEHYVAHQLLVKMHPGNHKLIYAANAMATLKTTGERVNNRMYGWLKRKYAKVNSEAMMGNTYGRANKGQVPWTKGRAGDPRLKHTEETKKLLSKQHKGIPLSEDHKAKIKASLVGWKPPPRTAEHEHNLAEANRARGKLRATCPHCGLEGSLYPMKQFHFDNCKTIKPEGYKRPMKKMAKRATVACPHCDKTGNVSPMKRWHFDNCKNIV